MKECMRELKAYKAAMQSLPSGCLAAEAEAEKQEKLSVEMTGSQTGPMSCSEPVSYTHLTLPTKLEV